MSLVDAQLLSGIVNQQGGAISATSATSFTGVTLNLQGGKFASTDLASYDSTWIVTGTTVALNSTSISGGSLVVNGSQLTSLNSSFSSLSLACGTTATCQLLDSVVASISLTTSDSAVVAGGAGNFFDISSLSYSGGSLAFTGKVRDAVISTSEIVLINGDIQIGGSVMWSSGLIRIASSSNLTIGASTSLALSTGQISGDGTLTVAGQVDCSAINILSFFLLSL